MEKRREVEGVILEGQQEKGNRRQEASWTSK